MKGFRMPWRGYGWYHSDYGRCFESLPFEEGKEYKAKIVDAVCKKKDCSHEEPDISAYWCGLGIKDLLFEEIDECN